MSDDATAGDSAASDTAVDASPAATTSAASGGKKRGRKSKEGGAKRKAVKSDRPPTMQLITEAIGVEKDPKGTSVLAIKKYIMANYSVKSSTMLNYMLKRALPVGITDGTLARPKGQAESSPLIGRYKLAGETKTTTERTPARPKKAKTPAKKAAAPPAKKTPKAKPAAASAKKAKSPKKVKRATKKPAAKKTPKKAKKVSV